MKVRDIEVVGMHGAAVLAVAEAGVGGRPLLLVHGFTGAKEDFAEWLDPLAELGWHAIAPDQRGHGDSARPTDEACYSFECFASDLLALLDAMGWTTAVALGHSMGGMVLQTAVIEAPDRFEAIVLMDTSHRALRADPGMVELAITIARTQGMAALMAAQDALDDGGGLGNEVDRRLKAERPGYLEFSQRKLLSSSPAMYAAMIAAITDVASGHDRLDALRSLTMPALVIVGEHDQPFVQPSRRMAEALPQGELVVVPNAAHSPQFESSAHWWSALRTFLEGV